MCWKCKSSITNTNYLLDILYGSTKTLDIGGPYDFPDPFIIIARLRHLVDRVDLSIFAAHCIRRLGAETEPE